MTALPKIHIGTSGWHYRHWVGPFYPPGAAPATFLERYAASFDTVEINSSFYRLPTPEIVAHWRDLTPPGFVFACKANRYITHMKKLKDPADSLARFLDVVGVLGDKLGPVLFQLPPRWRVNPQRLRDFLDLLPATCRAAFEFRDQSWHTDEVFAALAARNAALCLFDLAGRQSPEQPTADFVYVRLHGPGAAYQGSYSDDRLADWAARMTAWLADGREVYGYFDNDQKGHAPRDAARLRTFIDRLQ